MGNCPPPFSPKQWSHDVLCLMVTMITINFTWDHHLSTWPVAALVYDHNCSHPSVPPPLPESLFL